MNLKSHAQATINTHQNSPSLFRELNRYNLILDSDSYKFSHWKQYPKGAHGYSGYVESRGGVYSETVFFGLQYVLKKYLTQPITQQDIDEAEKFATAHGEPFNREGWEYILKEHQGMMPIRIKAVKEGTVVPTKNVLMVIESTDEKVFWLPSFLETMLLRAVWFPTTVATISYQIKKLLSEFHLMTAGNTEGVPFSLHDFGARGTSSFESSAIGGAAHLVNFLGSDTVAGVRLANICYGTKDGMSGYSIPACYDDQTDILTASGWKRFEDLAKEDKVAQYHEDGSLSFVKPSHIHRGSYHGDMIQFYTDSSTSRIDLLVTPNHRMVRRSLSTGKIEVQEAKDAKFSQRNKWLQGGVSSYQGSQTLSDLERLKVAFQADGSFPSRKDAYTGLNTGTLPIRFSMLKDRKLERLESILDSLSLDYSSNIQKNGQTHYWIKHPELLSKQFDWIDLTKVSSEWCQDFIEEISQWDGTVKSNCIIYTSIDRFNAEVVQSCAILAGYRASIQEIIDSREDYGRKPLYQVNICRSFNYRQGTRIRKTTINYQGEVYCVTVPTGMVVVRRNGYVSISGNSEHSTMTSWGREREADAYRNLLEVYGGDGKILACVSDSYDIYNAIDNIWGKQLKQAIIDSGSTLVIRPDSGDPVTVVSKCIQLADNNFGHTLNEKGFKVLNHVKLIQGDGVNPDSIKDILVAITEMGYCATNLAFGMGGALLQKLDRDTQKFALKCSAIQIDGVWHDVYKEPVTSKMKVSKKGQLELFRRPNGELFTDRDTAHHPDCERQLVTIFENGQILKEWTFDEVRANASL